MTLKACVLDADHNIANETPIFITSRGNVDGMTHTAGNGFGHHCYISSFSVGVKTSLDPINIELRTSQGAFVTQRSIQIKDQNPNVNLSIVDVDDEIVDSVLADGNEYLKIVVTDPDDDVSGAYGDAQIKWPGQPEFTVPIDFSTNNNSGIAIIPLEIEDSIENGDLQISVEITGANGLTGSETLNTPITLTVPSILSIDLCRDGVEVDELMFGQTADVVVRIKSTREIISSSATLEQFGWVVNAPQQALVDCGTDFAEQTDIFSFRIQLDSSFVPGDGALGVRITDIDELSTLNYLYFEFMHSPPEINVDHPQNVSRTSLIEILVEMNDADGIDATCSADYFQNSSTLHSVENSTVIDLDGTGIWSTSWLLPSNIKDNITFQIDCIDWSGNEVNYTSMIIIDPSDECFENCSEVTDQVSESSEGLDMKIIAGIAFLAFALIASSMYVRSKSKAEEIDTWQAEDENNSPERDERIPEGWTLEEFLNWLDGPIPDGWEDEQWELYRAGLEDLR